MGKKQESWSHGKKDRAVVGTATTSRERMKRKKDTENPPPGGTSDETRIKMCWLYELACDRQKKKKGRQGNAPTVTNKSISLKKKIKPETPTLSKIQIWLREKV